MNRFISYLQSIGEKHSWELVKHSAWIVLICWIPAQIIWLAFHFLYPGPTQENYFKTPFEAMALALLVAPILETQMMRMIFYAGEKFLKNTLVLCTVSAVIWGILHLDSESWGLHAAWAFFVMSVCFRRLQQDSRQRAVRVITLIHAVFNALSYGCYLLFDI